MTIATAPAGSALARQFQQVRQATDRLCDPLEADDYLLQSMPSASPVKWHLAHTTWFFETFLLTPHVPDYRPFRPEFRMLFNSYYEAVGPRWPRLQRGLLARPTVSEVVQYRATVDDQVQELLQTIGADDLRALEPVLTLGLHHEQQHQELILADLKHAWAANPCSPSYRDIPTEHGAPPARAWLSFPERLTSIGHDGAGFAFDNESPRHRVFLQGFQIANRLVTNGDFLAFMADGGYERPELWLSDGWATRQTAGWTAPLYWQQIAGAWTTATLAGERPVAPAEPVCHVSFYEADAFARWAGARLPTEAEWETAVGANAISGHFQEGGRCHPAALPSASDHGPLYQAFGDVWQWTASPYIGYPGYQPLPGALGEYNGKFMCNQFVLRGASCVTPRSHVRSTYRNFFPPDARWQFTGLRLARDLT